MKHKQNLFKKIGISTAIVGTLALTGCGATINQEITIHNEENVEAKVDVSYPSDYTSNDKIKEMLKSAYDEAPPEVKEKTKFEEYQSKDRTGIIYSIKEMDRKIYGRTFDMNVTKEDDRYKAVFTKPEGQSMYEGFTYKVTMPGTVTSSTAGTIDGRTVVWTPSESDTDLLIESKTYNPIAPMVIIGSTTASLLVVVVVTTTTVRKKKNK